MKNKRTIVFSSHMRIKAGVRYKVCGSKSTGKRKAKIEGFSSFSFNRDRNKLVSHARHIDRADDKYIELVVDPDTGEIIHRCEEKLSAHTGHGSAKGRSAT